MIVREAVEGDVPALAGLLDGFAHTHPARDVVRDVEKMRAAYFGDRAVGRVLLAEDRGEAIGFGIWRRNYDMHWSMYGGEVLGLYVIPARRGHGIAAAIVASMCAAVRESGGEFLMASYAAKYEAMYERVAMGGAERTGYVSAEAFLAMAELAGKPPREIVRGLPKKDLGHR
jgi:GNAT superfamily N-acetyltransferase